MLKLYMVDHCSIVNRTEAQIRRTTLVNVAIPTDAIVGQDEW